MWVWVGTLLAALFSWRRAYVWIAATIPVVAHIVGWVGRLWSAGRNTTLGRLLRMAGLLSVSAALSIGITRLIFTWVSYLIMPFPADFAWPYNPVIHGTMGLVNTLIPLNTVFDLIITWVYFSVFLLTIRLGKYILSLTSG